MPKDLVLLVADKNMDHGIRGLLRRPLALGIRPIETQIYVHPRRDPGCARESHAFLRPFIGDYRHAMVMLDYSGSGREDLSADALSREVRGRLAENGWEDRTEVIVLDPELEVWVFASSPHVERCLGWRGRTRLRRWLERKNLWIPDRPKPPNPRAALEMALFQAKKPRSSSVYQCLSQRVSVRGCVDPAFLKFRDTLARWFPAEARR
jgi:hypothetical protein